MIFDKLFHLMAEKGASDIFISVGTPIHIKIHGHTLPINQQVMDPPTVRKMVSELLTPKQMEQFERNKEYNLSHGVQGIGNFRINVFWQRDTIGAVIRFISGQIPTLEELHMPEILSEIIMEKRGLVLVVGATGSGKSTSLAAMINHRNHSRSGHILTVEDPIEYLFQHSKSVVNQREVGIDTISWNEALRNAMRQAPDCILIGEIRDRETMQAALAYAQTGHLCLATLHANNAYHALNRIVNFFPLENRPLLYLDLSVALKCIMSQRLVRRPDGMRIPAVELLMNTRHIADLIEHGNLTEIKEAMEQSLAPGSQTFEQDLFRLYREKKITLEEALTNSDSATNLSWIINNAQAEKAAEVSLPNSVKDKAASNDADAASADGGASFQEFSLRLSDDEPH